LDRDVTQAQLAEMALGALEKLEAQDESTSWKVTAPGSDSSKEQPYRAPKTYADTPIGREHRNLDFIERHSKHAAQAIRTLINAVAFAVSVGDYTPEQMDELVDAALKAAELEEQDDKQTNTTQKKLG
jgi:hypothetical protein